MRELYLDDIPLGSSNDDYENFLGKKFRMGAPFIGRPKIGRGRPATNTNSGYSEIRPISRNEYCDNDFRNKMANVRYANKEAYTAAYEKFMSKCRGGVKDRLIPINQTPYQLPPRPFGVSEIEVRPQIDEPVFVPKGTPLIRENVYGTVMQSEPMQEIPATQPIQEAPKRRPKSWFNRGMGNAERGFFGLKGLFGGLFRKRVKRPVVEVKNITIRAREIWDKDMESWSEALKRAEKQLVQEGGVTPATYLNFDSQGNAVGYEHETYDDVTDGDDYMEDTEDYSGFTRGRNINDATGCSRGGRKLGTNNGYDIYESNAGYGVWACKQGVKASIADAGLR